MQIEVVGFKELSTLYLDDLDFGEAWKACTEPVTLDRTKWLDLMIQDSMFLLKKPIMHSQKFNETKSH